MYADILKKCPLFFGVSEQDISNVIKCLCSGKRNYNKNEFIYHSGDKIGEIGIIISGSVQIIKEDIWGNSIILAELREGMLFGEAFIYSGISQIPLSVKATKNTTILFINKEKTMAPCSNSCIFHIDVSRNMLKILASKNVFLTERLEHLSKRTLREKILSYLSSEAAKANNHTFEIPFDRQGLADYLAADRSALSAVLSKLKSDGLIDYHRNKFTLIDKNKMRG